MGFFNIDVNGINTRYFASDNRLKFYNEFHDLFSPEKVFFQKYIKSGQAVLDLGCGAGRATVHIHKLTDNVIGTDISATMIESAKEKYRDIDFRVMDASVIKFPDCSFDVVVFSYNGLCCLYPEEKRLMTIREINRVLKKNGVFIFSSNNRFFPFAPYSLLNLIVTKLYMGFSSKYKIHITRNGIWIIYETTQKEETALLEEMNFELLEMIPMTEKVTFWGYKPVVMTYYAFEKK
jgi:ubiquinone/menaquinone biosynthesis C-methylase UbiE